MRNKLKGFSVLEIVLSAGLFAVFSLAIIVAVLQGSSAGQSGVKSEMARNWGIEGIEAVRAIKNQSFDALENTAGSGVRFENGKWEFFGSGDEWEGFRRVIVIESARRDGDNLISLGGTEDADLKLATVVVTKDDFSLDFSAYFSRREIPVVIP